MVDPSHSFHAVDYAVFGTAIAISIAIGVYYAVTGDRQRTTSEYLMGRRAMKFLPVAVSLTVSFTSSIMMLGVPAEVYVYGIQFWISCFGYLLAQLLSVFVVVPLLHPLKITSVFEYLQFRFNSTAVRLLGSVLEILTNIWYMGIVLFAPAVALEAVTGFSQWNSIFLVAVVAIIYTAIGGIKAVIWTDVVQAFIMYAGMLAILIKGTIDVGSPHKVWKTAEEGGRLNFFNFDPDPRTRHTFWSLLFGSFVRATGLVFSQSSIQRVISTKTQREARWVLIVMALCYFFTVSLACYEGIVIFAYYQAQGCDPLESNKITSPNQVILLTVVEIFKNLPGMPGLFLASLFSASLSTLSSGLNSLSALLWTDFIQPRIRPVSEITATIIAKICVAVLGVATCGVALLVSLVGGTLTQVSASLMAAFGGPLAGLFLLGCFCPGANAKGAFVGGLLSLLLTSWLSLGKTFIKSVKKQPWLPPASTAMCLANHTASLSLANHSTPYLQTYPSASLFNMTVSGIELLSNITVTSATGPTNTTPLTTTEPHGIQHVYTLSYLWLASVGTVATLVLGSVVSWLTGGNKKSTDHCRYVLSICDQLCCYLPESVRKIFRYVDDSTTGQETSLREFQEQQETDKFSSANNNAN